MRFAPIAIVGRSCLLPGAASPEALHEAVRAGQDLLSEVPEGRWRLDPRAVLREGPDPADATWTTRGGYVRSPTKLDPAFELQGLDPLFHWVLSTARAALDDAGFEPGELPRAGAVFGNLSFPSGEMSRFAEAIWKSRSTRSQPGGSSVPVPTPDPRNRFMSGLPALLLARVLGLGQGAFAIDAACASSLYAIRFAADALSDGRADLMLAGAVNRADDLFIHMGFTALKAISPTGQSRPFESGADGLIPAEGAAFLTLMRLSDARAQGRRIHGVIRAVGLSNDGRDGGLLAPSVAGQVRAMHAAYEESGLRPQDISLLECHATGTSVGDRLEIQSASAVFAGHPGLPIGSLKSNLGHLITVAGAAGLIKVIEAMRAAELPPTRAPEHPIEAIASSPLRLLTSPEPWEGPRRAAVSAFGFGGNNAHLIVEEDSPEIPLEAERVPPRQVAVIGIGAIVGHAVGARALAEALDSGESLHRTDEVRLPLVGIRFPPRDLDDTLPQQLLMLEAALQASEGLSPSTRVGVFVGMGTDPNVCRFGLRWREGDAHVKGGGLVRELVPVLGSAGVVGNMPNIVANRLNAQLDLGGGSATLSAEERSGLEALRLGMRAVAQGELEEALVGAVDLCCDPVHLAATGRVAADAAICLRLAPLQQAREKGAPILAILGTPGGVKLPPPANIGHATAAVALVQLAAAILGQHTAGQVVCVEVEDMIGGRDSIGLTLGEPLTFREPPPVERRSWAAHLPEIAFEASFQKMKPAPQLPPVARTRSASVASSEGSPPLPPDTRQNPTRPDHQDELLGLMREQMRLLSEAHRAHLACQQEQHERYLLLQERSLALLRARRTALVRVQTPTVDTPPAQVSPVPQITGLRPLPWDRQALQLHSSGRISELFGPLFSRQDGFARQVRMPEPPLLLADRVTALEASPGELGRGRVRTETDVLSDAWYLHQGHMPPGVMIESGQADLLLISYLGIDFLNQGDRVYRLLACRLTWHGGLPRVGDTLRYDIQVDGHANHDAVRLFFFHYDCVVEGQVRLQVREGQAGFFSYQELDESAGVLWTPQENPPKEPARSLSPPPGPIPSSLNSEQLQALTRGEPWEAFGPSFAYARTHTRGPRLQGGEMLLLHRVVSLDLTGGPWGRGYLRAEWDVSPDDWFFRGHFKNDPCMPGTLMFEGCLAAMKILMMSLGATLERDGWRFEPVPDVEYHLLCRGQATPRSRLVVYEVFVRESFIDEQGQPTLFADILCTVDKLKAFHTPRMGLRLVPDWPLSTLDPPSAPESGPVASAGGHRYNHRALLASALGKPSEAFGSMYQPFDGSRRVARLPGPPYHFMSRAERIEGEAGAMKTGARVVIAYDVPPDAWYFSANGAPLMPFCVLLEAALQPCGWLASFIGSALTVPDQELFFRNLDGTGTLHALVRPGAGTLHTSVTLSGISSNAGIIIVSFELEVTQGQSPIYTLRTVFGFFPELALKEQVGLPVSATARQLLHTPSERSFDLRGGAFGPRASGLHAPTLAEPMLLMLDRVTGWWPEGGQAGLGQARAEKDVDPGEWFFKAHFFQDPVQPGSLGIEAMIQLLQFVMREQRWHEGLLEPHFEGLATGESMVWRYRGQVLPRNRVIGTTLEVTRVQREEFAVTAWADAILWVDGKPIYEAKGLAVRVRGSRTR